MKGSCWARYLLAGSIGRPGGMQALNFRKILGGVGHGWEWFGKKFACLTPVVVVGGIMDLTGSLCFCWLGIRWCCFILHCLAVK